MFASLPPSFVLVVLLGMIGIPLYLLAYGGLSGPDLSGMMKGSDDRSSLDDDKTKDGGGAKKKRPNDDAGSPLDLSDLGGLGALVGVSALVVLGFTMFPQEIQTAFTAVTASFDLSLSHLRSQPLISQAAGRQAVGSTFQQAPSAPMRAVKAPSVDSVARHLRLLRAQPILLVGYNDDYMGTIALVLGLLATLPAAYIFGQLVWDAQEVAVHQGRLDASLKMQDEELRKAEQMKKRAELFEEDAKRIRRDQLNMLEEIKKAPPWWQGDFESYKHREMARRREENNVMAERATTKATLYKKRQAAIEEKWLPKEITKNGKTEKEENLFPGIPLLSYMRKRSRGGETKATLDGKSLLSGYPELSRLIMESEDLQSRSTFNKEGKAKFINGRLQAIAGREGTNTNSRYKMYSRWWEEDSEDYKPWQAEENTNRTEDQEYDAEEQRMRADLEKKIREKLLRGEKIEDAKGKRLGVPTRGEVREALAASEAKAAGIGAMQPSSAKSGSGGWKGFLKAIAP